ncbi:NADH-quinone oxidoreductase subunit M [Bacillus massiliglaciei]|uniref:NADH-quinone oxidoreductase subunit M n=1 Tax=Bacillus massiliglaciei TaxID=1816693 RepID=UPI000DA624DC|nr:NADH-quinone oxidoreductase subunit M [Bacillus massiliglaciei]
MNSYFLMVLVFSPLLGVMMVALMPRTEERTIKQFGVTGTVLPFLLSIYMYVLHWLGKDLTAFSMKFRWIRFGSLEEYDPQLYTINFELGVNGLSLLFIMLTTILALAAAMASFQIKKDSKVYFMLFFILEIGMLGVFTAENLILLFIFLELTLITMFFLIGKWGLAEKEKAAYHFLFYNGLGSGILLMVIMVLFARAGTTNIDALIQILTVGGVSLFAPISEPLKMGLCIALVISFGMKLPIFPFHRWAVRVHKEAPIPIVMLLTGVLMKIGAYGILSFGSGLFPEPFKDLSFYLALFGIIGLLYGSLLALLQTNLKKLLAYSSMSNMGIVLMGVSAGSVSGYQSAVYQTVTHSLIAALLFYLTGVLQERPLTASMIQLGGRAFFMPVFAVFFVTAGIASLGMPILAGFSSGFALFPELFKSHVILACIWILGLIMMAAYMWRAILMIVRGKPAFENKGRDLRISEYVPSVLLLALIVLIGLYPVVLSGPLQEVLAVFK